MFAQSVGAVEYAHCAYAEGKDSPNECPYNDTKHLTVSKEKNNIHWILLWIEFIIHSLELFTSVLADGFSLESEWQQVS